MDGTALVKSLDPKLFKEAIPTTFKEYSKMIFEENLLNKLQRSTRCDIVFDIYDREASLKAQTREGRGSGNLLKVKPDTHLPKDWKSFLRVSCNKTALFSYLADEAKSMLIPDGKDLVLTRGSQVVSVNSSFDTSELEPCNHEEADTRIFLHCKDAYQNDTENF